MNSTIIYEKYLKPSLPLLTPEVRERLQFFWVGTDPPGMLKPTLAYTSNQTYKHTVRFNKEMCKYAKHHSIPCLNPNSLLTNVFSVDGTHRGRGANWIKAQIALNIIEYQLRDLPNR